MPVRDHRNSQLWRAGFHGADMQPCTIHAVRPSLLISRPARLTRFDLRFMTAFDIPRETDPFLPPPPPPSPTRPRRWFVPLSLCVCVCVSSVAVCVCICVFFLNYRYFYHYPGGHLCSPWNIYIYWMNNNSWLFKTGWKVVGVICVFLEKWILSKWEWIFLSVVKLGEVLEECFGWIEEREGRFVSNVALDCFSGF